MRHVFSAVLIMLLSPLACLAQIQTGTYAHGAFDAKTFDTVNIGNLNVYFSLPVYSKPGRGLGLYYNLAYNSSIWTPASVNGSKTWTPVLNWGWTAETDAQTGYISDSVILASTCLFGGHKVVYEVWGNFAYHDKIGVVHDFPQAEVSNNPTCSGVPSSYNGQDTDPSGYSISINGNPGPGVVVTAPTGTEITAPILSMFGVGSTIDANGNTISVNSSGQVTDTTGNVVLTAAGTAPSPTTYTYTDTTNTSQHVTVTYSPKTVQTAFNCAGVSEFGPTSEYLITSISYPDGTSYSFSYEKTPGVPANTTGRLVSVTLPEGGVINYSYSGGSQGIECVDGGAAILTRSMPNDPLDPSTSYARTPGTNSSHTEVVDGLSNYGEYDFVNDPSDPHLTLYLVNYSQYQGAKSGTPLISNQSCLNSAAPPCTGQSLTLPITSITTTSTLNGTAVKQSALTYNSFGLITEDKEYDFGSGGPGTELSDTLTSYAFPNGPADLPSQIKTYLPSGVEINEVDYYYDQNSLTTKSGIPQLATVSGSRGNLTTVEYVTGASSPTAISTAQFWYDNAGQIVTSEDAKLNQTTYSYDSGTDTFQTGVTYPTTGGVAHSTGATWDVIRGVMLSSTDMNHNTTTYTYDPMLRPSTTSGPGGWNQTFGYSFGPSSPNTSVSTLHATGGSNVTMTAYLDPYGRRIKTDSTDTPSDDLVTYAYDGYGNVNSVSNPYRSGGTVSNTIYTFDALGRPTKILDSDGSSTQTASYSGNSVTATDEAGHQRELSVDGLGRINKVMEPDSSGSLTLETDYLYDQNAVKGSGSTFTTYQTIVNQKGGSGSQSNWRTRTLTFDMLGRTTTSVVPESGTTTYTYPNGSGSCAGIATLVCGRTDANATLTTYSYDALNRPTGRTYSGSSIGNRTPSVTYYYDQTSYNGLTISNGNGPRTGMSDGSGATAWSFDGMGRTASIRKTINSVTKQAVYTYNADGSINTVDDYGGTTFTYSYDVSGRPISVVDGSSNSYAGSGVYNAAGQLTSLIHQLTSSGGRYARSIQYNTMLQPSVISATLNGNTIQSLSYGYGTAGTDNGTILSITNGMDSSRSQTYTYDPMNRLASGRDTSHWGETYTYDNWGNLYQTTQMSGLGGNNWSVTANGNNQLSNLTYDSAGEVSKDQYGDLYTYDAEGRILAAGTGTYVYDGDGNRVEKNVSGTTALYWPGASGILNESNSSGSAMGKQVQFDGLLVWHEDTSGTGEFLFQDQLGSTRMTGSASGTVKDDIDYQSYGNLYHNYGSSPSDNHYLFTGDESDSETTSAYAVFRNLGTTMGRFNRPDPYAGSYDLTNPQSMNRYSYALNNPQFFVDPSGLFFQTWNGDTGDTGDPCLYDDFFCGGGGPYPDPCNGPDFTCANDPGEGPPGGGGGGGGGGAASSAPNSGPTAAKGQPVYECSNTGGSTPSYSVCSFQCSGNGRSGPFRIPLYKIQQACPPARSTCPTALQVTVTDIDLWVIDLAIPRVVPNSCVYGKPN